jgi:hypothetical protein
VSRLKGEEEIWDVPRKGETKHLGRQQRYKIKGRLSKVFVGTPGRTIATGQLSTNLKDALKE